MKINCIKYESDNVFGKYSGFLEFMPKFVEIISGDDEWTIKDFLITVFDKIILEWVIDFEPTACGGCIYLAYSKGLKPTRKEIEQMAKKHFPEDIEESNELKHEWRVWKK